MNARAWTVLVVGVVVLTGVLGKVALELKRRGGLGGGPRDTPELRAEREENRREAAVAFNDPVEPSAADAAEFAPVLARFSAAIRDEDAGRLADLFAPGRVFDELVRQAGGGLPVRNTASARAGFERGFRASAGNAVFNPVFQWDTTALRRVRWSADRTEAVVAAAHRRRLEVAGESTLLTLKMRWWFVRQGGEWRVYDFEDLDGGIRLTATMAALFTPGFEDRIPRVRDALVGMRDAQVAILAGDLDGMEAGLARARGVPLPPAIEAAVTALEAVGKLGRGDADGALKAIDRAGQLNPDMPARHALRSTCLNATGDYAGALAAADLYVAQLGPDADLDVQRGAALAGLGRPAEAAAAYRRALDDDPDSKDALEGLRAALPAGGKGELADRFAKVSGAAKLFDELVRSAREDDDGEAVRALERGLRKVAPADARGVTAELRRLVGEEKFADAAAELKAGLRAVGPDDRGQVLNAYLFAMAAGDRHLAAYAAVPDGDAAAAFRTLAEDLDDEFEEFDPADPPAEATRLRELIAAHRKRSPRDPWLGFYEGCLLQGEKEYEKAERAFAAAEAAYRKAPPAPRRGDGKDWAADQFRYRRVRCLYQAKEPLKAYAEVGPAADTFDQLAGYHESDNDVAGLRELVAAHRKRAGGDVGLAYWEATLAYREAEYGKAADGFSAYLAAAGEKAPRRWVATDRCVRAYLRAGKPAKARAAVAEFGNERVGPGLRAAVALADGKEAEADEVLAGLAKERGGFGFVYHDEDFARLVARPEFAGLRKKYPDPRAAPPPRPVG